MQKKTYGLIITLFIMLFGIPAIASAATSGTCGSSVRWVLDGDTLTISGSGKMSNFTNYDSGSPSPFKGNKDITKVIINYGVSSVGDAAFYECSNIQSVILPGSISEIGSRAFSFCTNLSDFECPAYLSRIGNSAFLFCSSLTSINLGWVVSIEEQAFANCSNLTEFSIANGNNSYCTVDGVLFNKSMSKLICYPAAKANSEYTIPNTVTEIGAYAFSGCNKTTDLVFPNNLLKVGKEAFSYSSSIKEVALPDTVTTLEYGAFHNCEGLESIIVPPQITWLQPFTLSSCSNLKHIELPVGLVYIFQDAIAFNPKLEELVIPDTVVSISQYAFAYNTNLKSVTLPYSLKNVDNDVFKNDDSLSDVYFTGTAAEWAPLKAKFNLPLTVTVHTVPQFTYVFTDENGAVLKEETVRENSIIVAPEPPTKTGTSEFTYEFDSWSGFEEGMRLTANCTFTATYKTITNQYTYSFLDDDGSSIKTIKADYGSRIEPPEMPETSTEWFYNKTFTGWTGYVDDMILTEDVSFTANYARQLIPNKSQIEGASTADVGAEGVEENVYFSSDSSVKSAVFEITHSNDLELASVTPVDFKYATINEATSKNGFTTSKVVAVYSGTESISSDSAINPFAANFKVLTTANTGNTSIRISKITLNLDDGSTKEITETLSQAFEITPRKVDSIKIRAVAYGSGYTRYEAIITPNFATNQKIVWSVDNESIATITKDGTLYPKQNGTVVIKAETEDGEVSDTLSVNVKAYAKIASLKSNVGVWNRPFNENRRSYMIVVKPNVNSITLTPEYSQGIVMHDSKILLTNTPLSITLDGELTTVVLTCSGVEDTTDSKYTFNIVRTSDLAVIEETPPSRSDGTFDINVSLNGAPENTRVYVGIYDYSGCLLSSGIADSATGNETVTITPSAYRNAERYKIFLWNGSSKMQPVCDPYEGELY